MGQVLQFPTKRQPEPSTRELFLQKLRQELDFDDFADFCMACVDETVFEDSDDYIVELVESYWDACDACGE